MKLHLIFIFTATVMAYQDVGNIGTTYPIEEEDILDKISVGIEHLDRSEISKKLIISAKAAYRVDAPFTGCISEVDHAEVFTVESQGQYSLSGEIIITPGTPIKPKMGADSTACVVDASNMRTFDASMEGFKKRNVFCDVLMVSGRGADEVASMRDNNSAIYPYSQNLGEVLNLRCLPSAVVIKKGIKRTVEFNAAGDNQ